MKAKSDKDFHKLVCERDSYICYMCKKDFSYDCYFQGEVNQYVCADHIATKGSHPELRLETDNGRCVCFDCHLIRHS